MNTTTIGLDIAKAYFLVHGVDALGKLMKREALTAVLHVLRLSCYQFAENPRAVYGLPLTTSRS